MIYRLSDPVSVVKGIGDTLQSELSKTGIETVLDLLLYLPYRYEDRSQIITIDQLKILKEGTIKAIVRRANIQYRGRRATVRAAIEDATGKINCIWFNNRFVINQLKEGSELYFAGKMSDRGMLVQPTVEKVSDDTIHTARLVPMYSQISKSLKIGSLRRLLKSVTDQLNPVDDLVANQLKEKYPNFIQALQTLHFPENEAAVPTARERLALEEILGLIQHSQQIKEQWQKEHNALAMNLANYEPNNFDHWLPKSIPFQLTGAQQQATREILADLENDHAMNRILVGDVGAGKTVVAGLACYFVLQNNQSAVLMAPTQILAQQHVATFQKILPEINVQLLTTKESATFAPNKQPTLYIGTHALINHLEKIQPALIVYDEQHRFGVKQRTNPKFKTHTPHVLTMSATPIPRSLMLTLFSHLELSIIDELPANQIPTTTWLVSNQKRNDSLSWLGETVSKTHGQALVICPFIEPSSFENLSNVAAAKDTFENLKKFYMTKFPKLKLGLLHGKLKPNQKQQVIDQLFQHQIDILVTTPVVEVGVDLPDANIMVVEGAERFGLASLHQLRGRVGRAGQESWCMLFTSPPEKATNQSTTNHQPSEKNVNKRLLNFTKEHNGLKLAEQDLEHRGAGDLFGFRQHGLTDLKFSSWTNLELIKSAQQVFQQLSATNWQPLIPYQLAQTENAPAAN